MWVGNVDIYIYTCIAVYINTYHVYWPYLISIIDKDI